MCIRDRDMAAMQTLAYDSLRKNPEKVEEFFATNVETMQVKCTLIEQSYLLMYHRLIEDVYKRQTISNSRIQTSRQQRKKPSKH